MNTLTMTPITNGDPGMVRVTIHSGGMTDLHIDTTADTIQTMLDAVTAADQAAADEPLEGTK